MIYSFTVENIPCSLSGHYYEESYRLSNHTILLPSERDQHGNYYGGVGLGGIFLRTDAIYCPIYNEQNKLCAFEKINPTTA